MRYNTSSVNLFTYCPLRIWLTMRHGTNLDPPNRFEKIQFERNLEDVSWDAEYLDELAKRKVEFLDDDSQTIVSTNNSPDLNFRYSINPYRGCEHGCSYCYARPSHEYLGLNAGLDFETKIVVKRNAPELFRRWLRRPGYRPEALSFSGVTDCYQPAERHFRLTRGCLEVAAAAKHPVSVITKNALVARDLDLVATMAQQRLLRVAISITTLDKTLAGKMEPRTSVPQARLDAIAKLSSVGVPVMAMVAPIKPGLNDHEIPALLKSVAEAGAQAASYVVLRLPATVKTIFVDWLQNHFPDRVEKVLGRLRSSRGGNVHNAAYGVRMTGHGEMAEQIRRTFKVFQLKLGLGAEPSLLDYSQFQPPERDSRQQRLF